VLVAFLADIHGNAPALEAVLADLPPVDAIVCCGDIVGYYPDANEVIDRLRTLGVATVRGNHELMLCGARAVAPERAAQYRIEWTRQMLSAEHLRWLKALPRSLEFEWDRLVVTVRHASPWDEETYLYPDSDSLRNIQLEPNTWLIVGHSHHPLYVHCGAGWLANPGSVGQPRDWDPRAAYGLLDTRTNEWQARRVAYDHTSYQRHLEALGWEPRMVAILGRTRAPAVED
jgi:putative phosphoesterase